MNKTNLLLGALVILSIGQARAQSMATIPVNLTLGQSTTIGNLQISCGSETPQIVLRTEDSATSTGGNYSETDVSACIAGAHPLAVAARTSATQKIYTVCEDINNSADQKSYYHLAQGEKLDCASLQIMTVSYSGNFSDRNSNYDSRIMCMASITAKVAKIKQ